MTTGVVSLPLLLAATLLILWRPSAFADLPMIPFLLCIALAAVLLIAVGLMGADRSSTNQ
ncbi:hypothetical protein [Cryptosporangium aurantiacum]|uniref:Uncharacterized protein n=1 Tax=Cryptosporangium aurantiacum TaxID=134849 RepID=A0A1M7PCX9_9ACTN|nr:hypothetical protein [Cryptosporangium aurantiacum]SHN14314.1 hypothetical protein SAMN05443668_103176 [Cryptosporangium aurantiacum]